MLMSFAEAGDLDVSVFDMIVMGASVHYGKHPVLVAQFIQRHRLLLARKPNAFFSVNIVARKPEKSQPDTNPYLIRFLQQMAWTPKLVAVFAGKLDYPSYRFFDRLMIRLIMFMTKGPTDPAAVIEFTDWLQVDAFARRVSQMA